MKSVMELMKNPVLGGIIWTVRLTFRRLMSTIVDVPHR